jgi:hypothetical protein
MKRTLPRRPPEIKPYVVWHFFLERKEIVSDLYLYTGRGAEEATEVVLVASVRRVPALHDDGERQ